MSLILIVLHQRDSHQQVLDTALRCVDSVLYLLWRHIYFFIRVAPFAPQVRVTD